MPIQNVDLETVSLSTNPQFVELIERSRARVRAEGGISSKAMRRRFSTKAAGKKGKPRRRHS